MAFVFIPHAKPMGHDMISAARTYQEDPEAFKLWIAMIRSSSCTALEKLQASEKLCGAARTNQEILEVLIGGKIALAMAKSEDIHQNTTGRIILRTFAEAVKKQQFALSELVAGPSVLEIVRFSAAHYLRCADSTQEEDFGAVLTAMVLLEYGGALNMHDEEDLCVIRAAVLILSKKCVKMAYFDDIGSALCTLIHGNSSVRFEFAAKDEFLLTLLRSLDAPEIQSGRINVVLDVLSSCATFVAMRLTRANILPVLRSVRDKIRASNYTAFCRLILHIIQHSNPSRCFSFCQGVFAVDPIFVLAYLRDHAAFGGVQFARCLAKVGESMLEGETGESLLHAFCTCVGASIRAFHSSTKGENVYVLSHVFIETLANIACELMVRQPSTFSTQLQRSGCLALILERVKMWPTIAPHRRLGFAPVSQVRLLSHVCTDAVSSVRSIVANDWDLGGIFLKVAAISPKTVMASEGCFCLIETCPVDVADVLTVPTQDVDESVSAAANETEVPSCIVCTESIDPCDASVPCVLLPCMHKFHRDCIAHWWKVQAGVGNDATCVVCRQTVAQLVRSSTDISSLE